VPISKSGGLDSAKGNSLSTISGTDGSFDIRSARDTCQRVLSYEHRWRFSLRTLLTLPLLVAIGIILVDRFWVYDISQSGTELVAILLVDGEDGTPIAGAVLQSSDVANEPNAKTTNADGKVGFAHSYKYEHFKSLLRDRYSHLSAHAIAVNAPGFEPVSIELKYYRLGKGEEYGLPYPIVIRLERSTTTMRIEAPSAETKTH
jgi:hypothetical protein